MYATTRTARAPTASENGSSLEPWHAALPMPGIEGSSRAHFAAAEGTKRFATPRDGC
eukprot:CAMPEP_0176232430 /NCGR_PEP_ID=MMETSP0121_2-20121125/25306_1 /TAXON_ID=160619 /ORGANISM="Kryptoperidinium foliaceum, Strain CCMP 1326" /LENGTH=56 /DNA_ID=CAMNT_0017571795 /DNA_START=83 /DNA_END=250 /DNA_ORIENTATION=+